MNDLRVRWGGIVLAVSLVLGAVVIMNRAQPAGGAETKPLTGAHYTVVETEGHNLLVTDNETNTLYFYTVDKGEAVGSELKLRGKVDLTQVGKEKIKPVAINIQKP